MKLVELLLRGRKKSQDELVINNDLDQIDPLVNESPSDLLAREEGRSTITMEETDSREDNKEKEYEVVEIEILPQKIICPDCGGITLEGLEFCDKCGGEL